MIEVNSRNLWKYKEVFLVDSSGNKTLSIKDAFNLAKSQNLDLVLVDETKNPPVAKILDYHKEQYEAKKKFKKPKNRTEEVKIFQFHLVTQANDLDTIAKKASKALDETYKVRFECKLKGRFKGKGPLAVPNLEYLLSKVGTHTVLVAMKTDGDGVSITIRRSNESI